MKRPSDQAKLLFLGLLRTASALASGESRAGAAAASWHMSHHLYHAWRGGSSTATAAVSSSSPALTSTSWKMGPGNNNKNQQLEPKKDIPLSTPPALTLRLARRTDVPSMQRCNLATLPENYNGHFYVQHMRQWPELALVVVEDMVEKSSGEDRSSRENLRHVIGSNSGLSFSPFPTQNHLNQQEPPSQVVAYVLGKVEERTVERFPDHSHPTDWLSNRLPPQAYYETHLTGHITSLAVLQDYRRQGLAAALMEQLHVQLQRHYPSASQVGLHVRQSNQAATGLYKRFGYVATECIPTYYQDGEDAYYMMKDLKRGASVQRQQPSQQRGGLFASWKLYQEQEEPYQQRRNSVPENFENEQDPWTMPRAVGQPPREEEPEEQLMSGTF